MLSKLQFLLAFILLTSAVTAQIPWTNVPESGVPTGGERRIIPQHYRTVRLNIPALESVLATAPERFTPEAQYNPSELTIPMPDGTMARFTLTESPVMAAGLQDLYRDIRCYSGRGIDDPTATIKCDLTPWGFHALVRSVAHGTVFIDPYTHGDREYYVVYYKADYVLKNEAEHFACATTGEPLHELHEGAQNADLEGDCRIRRYRLALACTGEYAAFHGNTKPLVLAAMNTTMNRVNGVYENDFAVTMQIVAKNDTLIFLNAASDPYTNNDGGTMLSQNQVTCNARIGTANYDIGHVFSTGGGGIAGLGVVCGNSKAQGVTGLGSPIGDAFDIDYVAHEIGHQFGGNHSFNSSQGSCNGNQNNSTAMEPGSGTTIMSYAGICGTHNVQTYSDDYFHAINVQEINNFIITGTGNNCPVKITSGNANPTVSGGADYIIPKSTPFALTATGSDPDGDVVTYCWEQMDPQTATMPPVATNTAGPMFRSFKGVITPTRYFPRLTDLVNNVNPVWEKLPAVARALKFRVTARDNNSGAGCTNQDDVVVTVSSAAGPFVVTAPNTNVTWYVGGVETVTWSVASTNTGTVNCANVRLSLSTDGGFTYPVILASSVPNNGTAQVNVPNNIASTCRVKAEGIGNIFFDISNQNFSIQAPPTPTFILAANATNVEVCAGGTTNITLNLTALAGFTTPVNLSVTGAPTGTITQINPNPASPTGIATLSISGFTPDMAGVYTLNVRGSAGAIQQNIPITLTVFPGEPTTIPALFSPADGQTGLELNTFLTWSSASFATVYTVQIATNPAFSPVSIVVQQTLNNDSLLTPALQVNTVYYWRVRAENNCGAGAFSTVRAFQIGAFTCGQVFTSTDVPQLIDDASVNTAISTLTIPTNKVISSVKVSMQIDHTYVGDISAVLTAPVGQDILLFERPGVPDSNFGCAEDNVDLTLDDAATLTAAELENTCNTGNFAISGTYQPVFPLGDLDGLSAGGTWQLAVTDNYPDDGGSINSWQLAFCFVDSSFQEILVANNPLLVPQAGNGIIATANLQQSLHGTAAQGTYTVLSLPTHGTLTQGGVVLAIGSTFTQAEIDGGLLVYNHDGSTTTTDGFYFDALDVNDAAWLHNALFTINIQLNNLVINAVQSATVNCYNGVDGQITVTTTGLNGQYSYSLNGQPVQTANVFNDLTPGNYSVVVTGQFGFTATSNVVILQNPTAIVGSASVNMTTLTVGATGGAGAYQYSLDGTTFQPENIFENVANGIYTVTVRDANGCTGTTQAIVAVNTLLASSTVATQIACSGSTNGSITVLVGGGQLPYSYQLNNGAFQPENTFFGLGAGVYTIIVQDAQGFEAIANTVTLVDPAALTAAATANLNVVTVTATGGTGVLSYSSDGTNFQTDSVLQNLTAGIYNITVHDANGCTTVTQVEVIIPVLEAGFATTEPIACFGGDNANLFVNAIGGVPPYRYSLNAGPFQTSNAFSGLNAGPHTIMIRDAAGTELLLPEFTFQQPAAIQSGLSIFANDASIDITGGTGMYTYTLNGLIGAPLNNLANGAYTLIITDGNGCTTSSTFTIDYTVLNGTLQAITTDPCLQLGNLFAEALGGTPPYEYALGNGVYQSNPEFDNLTAGTYTVQIRDSLGDVVSQTATINAPTALTLTADVVENEVTGIPNGGTPPYQYTLEASAPQEDPLFTALPNGVYTLTISDANNCTATTTVIIQSSSTIEPGVAWGLSLAPNPSKGLFRLTLTTAPTALEATIFDINGQQLRKWDFSPGSGIFTTMLDVSELPAGMYILRLTDGLQTGSVRVMVAN